MSRSEKIAVIGWDGADWRYINPLLEKGELPNLEKIINQGGKSNLNSVRPTMSPVAWSSYSTGTDPSQHGIYDFLQRKNQRFLPVTSKDINKPYFWDKLDRKVGIVNIPMTYPPKQTEGVLVSGYLSSKDNTYTYPEELTEDLNDKDYIIETLSIGYDGERTQKILDRAETAVDKRTDTCLRIINDYKPDFFHVTYTGLDRLQHYYPLPPSNEEFGSAVSEHYKKLDESIGRIREELVEDATVIVMSDHGFREMKTEVYLNHWMKKKGYLVTENSESLLTKLGVTQQRIAPLLRSTGLLNPLKQVFSFIGFDPSKSVPKPGMNSIDLSETKAYCGNYRGALYLVEENIEDLEEFKEVLEEELLSLEFKREKVFKEILDTEEIYDDPNEDSPDFILVPNTGFHIVGFMGRGSLYSEKNTKTGVHDFEGIIASNSEEINLENPRIVDLAPTILELYSREIPDYMTGKSLVSKE